MSVAGFKNLCSPALLYLVISLIAMVVIAFQNYTNEIRSINEKRDLERKDL